MRLPLLAALLAALTGLAVPLAAAAPVEPAPGKRRPVAPSAAPRAEDPVPATPEEMEARRSRVDAERKLQEKAFDDRVRRATTSICSGCTTGGAAPSRRARSAGAERDTAPSDPAEAPPLPTARP